MPHRQRANWAMRRLLFGTKVFFSTSTFSTRPLESLISVPQILNKEIPAILVSALAVFTLVPRALCYINLNIKTVPSIIWNRHIFFSKTIYTAQSSPTGHWVVASLGWFLQQHLLADSIMPHVTCFLWALHVDWWALEGLHTFKLPH